MRTIFFLLVLFTVLSLAYVVFDVEYGPTLSLKDFGNPTGAWNMGGRLYWDLFGNSGVGAFMNAEIDLGSREPRFRFGIFSDVNALDPLFLSLWGGYGSDSLFGIGMNLGLDLRFSELTSLRASLYMSLLTPNPADVGSYREDFGIKVELMSSSYSRSPRCRSIAPGTISLSADGKADVCPGAIRNSVILPKSFVEDALKGIELVKKGKVFSIESRKLKVKAVKVTYRGEEIFIEDGGEPRKASPGDPDLILEILGTPYRLFGYGKLVSESVPEDFKIAAFRAVSKAVKAYLLGSGEKFVASNCGAEKMCRVDEIDLEKGIIVCGGEEIPVDVEKLDVKLNERIERWVKRGEPVSITPKDVLNLGDLEGKVRFSITVDGTPVERFRVSKSGVYDITLVPSSSEDCVIYPEGGIKAKVDVILRELPGELRAPEGLCVVEGYRGRISGVGDDGKEYEVDVLEARDGSVKVDLHGHTYELKGVGVIGLHLDPISIEATSATVVEISEVLDASLVEARGGGIEAVYSGGEWRISGDLRKAGKFDLKISRLETDGCREVLGRQESVTVIVSPNYERPVARIRGEVYADEGGEIEVKVTDRFGNPIKGSVVLLDGSSVELLGDEIPRGTKPGVYRKAVLKVGGREFPLSGDIEVVVLPGAVSDGSGFVVDGKVYEKIGKTPGKHWVRFNLVDEFGNDLSDFFARYGYSVEPSVGGVAVKRDGRSVMELSGVEDYSPAEGKVLLKGGNVEVDYKGRKKVFEVVEVPEAGAKVDFKRTLGGVEIRVSGGVCTLNVGGRILENVDGRAFVPVPGFFPVDVSYSCSSDVKLPVVGEVSGKGVAVLPPVSLEFGEVEVVREIPKVAENTVYAFPSVSKDGRYVAYISKRLDTGDGYLIVKSLSGGRSEVVFKGVVSGMDWSQDGHLVFSGSAGGDYRIFSYNPASGDFKVVYEKKGRNAVTPSFDIFGNTVVFSVEGDGIYLGRFEGGKVEGLRRIPIGVMPAVSVDGKVAYSRNRGAYVWVDGEEIRMDSDDSIEADFSWSPDGKWVVYYKRRSIKGDVILAGYDIDERREYILVEGVRREFGRVLWVGADRFVFGNIGDDELAVYSLKDRKVIRTAAVSYSGGEIVSTGFFQLFTSESGVGVTFGGYLITEEGKQRDTVFEGRLK